MSKAYFIPIDVGHYIRDTQHLTTEQHGAYLLLLMAMWVSGGELPNDARKLARIARATPSRWARIGSDVMAYFEIDGGFITHGRLKNDLQKAEVRTVKAKTSGGAGGRATALKNKEAKAANATADATAKDGEAPQDSQISDIIERPPTPPEGGALSFETFWRAYPSREASTKTKAAEWWLALSSEDRAAALAALTPYAAYCRKAEIGICRAERYLWDRRWESFDLQLPQVDRDTFRLSQFLEKGFWPEGWGCPPNDSSSPLHARWRKAVAALEDHLGNA